MDRIESIHAERMKVGGKLWYVRITFKGQGSYTAQVPCQTPEQACAVAVQMARLEGWRSAITRKEALVNGKWESVLGPRAA